MFQQLCKNAKLQGCTTPISFWDFVATLIFQGPIFEIYIESASEYQVEYLFRARFCAHSYEDKFVTSSKHDEAARSTS